MAGGSRGGAASPETKSNESGEDWKREEEGETRGEMWLM